MTRFHLAAFPPAAIAVSLRTPSSSSGRRPGLWRALGQALLLLCSALPLTAAHADSSADDRFLAARDAFRAGDAAKLERLAPGLADHDLAAYVDYFRLRMRLDDNDTSNLRSWLDKPGLGYAGEKLRADWLRFLAKKQRWTEFTQDFPGLQQPEQDLVCLGMQGKKLAGEANAYDAALPLWLTLMDIPDACYKVFEGLIEERKLTADDVWLRMRRLAAVERTGSARTIAQYLPESQTPDEGSLSLALDKGVVYLAKLPGGSLAKTQRELAALALIRMAKSDPNSAYERYQRVRGQLTGNERGAALAAIAWQAAFRHQPEAADWFRDIGDLPANALSEEQHAWRVRAALRVQDWAQVRSAIEKMPPALAADPAWVYWLGRAYHAGGRTSEAHALFGKIAGQPNFYGNLADDELGRPIMPPPKAKAPTRDEQTQALSHPGLKRALAFFRLGLRTEAVKEWNWALRGMNDRELLAAAELAHRNEIFDRAINTADKTKNEHDYNLRYLAPYGDQVRPAARQQGLDGAWVYGLMRQESRFISNAKSVVGAGGLMQVMPATARWVAKKIGLKDFQPARANDPETNILLGTSYLRLVLESLDNHPVLASAAYNAGPGRAKKWRDAKPLEGAIYAETIPFSETRDYVKKVMSNAVYYSALFDGRPQTLKTKLGTIAPRGTGETKGEDLP